MLDSCAHTTELHRNQAAGLEILLPSTLIIHSLHSLQGKVGQNPVKLTSNQENAYMKVSASAKVGRKGCLALYTGVHQQYKHDRL